MEAKEIAKKLKEIAPRLADTYGLDFLILFGSAARGAVKRTSDIDIGVSGRLSFKDELSLAVELSDIFGDTRVDLVNLQRVSPLLAHSASHEALLIYERTPGDFARFRMRAFHIFVETKPLREAAFERTKQYSKQT